MYHLRSRFYSLWETDRLIEISLSLLEKLTKYKPACFFCTSTSSLSLYPGLETAGRSHCPRTTLPSLALVALQLRDLVVRWGTAEPLWPGTIINSHITLATQVGCQGNVTCCDTFAARGCQRLWEIHFLLTEYLLNLLNTLLVASFC